MSYTDSLIIVYCCLSALLHLLEVGILDIVVSLRAIVLSLTSLTVHLSTGSLNSSVQVAVAVSIALRS
jgi:hypothetical protein